MKTLSLLLLAVVLGYVAGAQCSASFTGTQNPSGNNLLNFDFTSNSNYGTVTSSQLRQYQITYGDGSSNSGTVFSSPAALPSHAYAAPGTYTAGLTISKWDTSTHSVVCSSSTTITINVAYPSCGTVLSATGTGAAQSLNASNPAGTSGMSYAWNFGDGSTGSGASPTHTYASYGTYYLSCVASRPAPAACSYTNYLTITIAPPVSPASINCSLTLASFTATVGSGGSYVNCTNTSTVLTYPYITRQKWDFGDGTISYTSGLHYYAATGTYTVKLDMDWVDTNKTVSCSKTISHTVNITSISGATMEGEIGWDSVTFKGAAYSSYKVWLIQFNPATNILTAVDSQLSTWMPAKYGPCNAARFVFTNKPNGNYLIKAALNSGPTSGTGIVPTYATSSPIWSSAKTIVASNGSGTYDFIYMMNGTVTSGPGFVGGNVTLGANKGTSGGVSDLTVYLINPTNKRVVQATVTDANGDFSFSNILPGSYNVHPELMNYVTTAALVSVTGSNTSVTGVTFRQDDAKMNIKPTSLAVGQNALQVNNWSIFPNPSHNQMTIFWTGSIDMASGIVISDITGKKVLQAALPVSAQGRQNIDINALSPGLYLVNGIGTLNGAAQKLIVE